MKFAPYTSGDFQKVILLLEKHIDFTPEVASPDPEGNLDLFKEEDVHAQSYILRSDDDTCVYAFMRVSKHSLKDGGQCFYVPELYAKNDGFAEDHAKTLLIEFEKSLFETKELCGIAHPQDQRASDFWQSNGYALSPERSIYNNIDDETLVAYRKPLQSCAGKANS